MTPFVTPWTIARQAPLSGGFPRQENWSGLPFASPRDLPDPGIEPESSTYIHTYIYTYIYTHVHMYICVNGCLYTYMWCAVLSCSVMSNSATPRTVARLLCPWNSPGQNTGVSSLSLLQGIFQTQGLNPGLLHCRWILYCLSHQGSPRILEWGRYIYKHICINICGDFFIFYCFWYFPNWERTR